MTTIYLVRHCETQGNRQRLFQGRMDMDISEAGGRQLDRLAERFRDMPLDALYSSPLLRAMRTAEAVNRHHGLSIRQDERLIEINGGCWEGKSWAELPTLDPEQSRRWLHEPWNFQTDGGEPMRAVYDRMKEALLAIAAACDGGRVAVVSHGCAIRNALCFAKGLPVERLNEVGWCDNTAVCTLMFEGERVQVLAENDHTHLDEQEASPAEKDSWWR